MKKKRGENRADEQRQGESEIEQQKKRIFKNEARQGREERLKETRIKKMKEERNSTRGETQILKNTGKRLNKLDDEGNVLGDQ